MKTALVLGGGGSRFLPGLAGLLLKALLIFVAGFFLIAHLAGTGPGAVFPMVDGAVGSHPFLSGRAVIGAAVGAATLLTVIIASAAGSAAYHLHLSDPPLLFFLIIQAQGRFYHLPEVARSVFGGNFSFTCPVYHPGPLGASPGGTGNANEKSPLL